MLIRRVVAVLSGLAFLLPAALLPVTPAVAAPAAPDLRDQLAAIPGLTVVSESQPTGYRFFVLGYRQPVDHKRPWKGWFTQRLTLLHRATDAPVVLSTSGYGLAANPQPSRAEPTRLLDGNQVSVEHRFFTPSRPEPADWDTLNIWQEATDEHRIVTALKGIYSGRWIQTGGSKGGMTSVYHRRFYPGDVAGVVAYVAPNDAVNPFDVAYDRFFATVGTPGCRAALDAVQREALKRRAALLPLLAADAAGNGWTYAGTLGTIDRSFELSVLDLVWTFWQYSLAEDCATVPAATATDREIYDWIDLIVSWSFYTDQGIDFFVPYYRQAATQLGWPSLRFAHLRGLTRYPGLYQPNSVLPPSLDGHHDPLPMLDVDHWVRTASERMMFIYGENDPWGAERFAPSRRDSYLYVAPGANHGANIARLSPADGAAATATLRRWAGLPAASPSAASAQRSAGSSVPDDDGLVDRRAPRA